MSSIAVAALVLQALLLPRVAHAQEIATNLAQLQTKVKLGDTIFVTESAGREERAQILNFTPTTLVVSVKGVRREIPFTNLTQIRQTVPDSLRNGLYIGAAAGVALGAVEASQSNECSADATSGACIGPVVIIAGLGAGAGLGLDALIHARKVIYQAPGKTVSLRMTPLVTPRRVGMRMAIQFDGW